MRVCALLLVLAFAFACGDVRSNADASIDAPDDDASTVRCDRSAPVDAPMAVAALNSVGLDADAWLARDRLTIYLRSNRLRGANNDDLFYAMRATATGVFGAPAPLSDLN